MFSPHWVPKLHCPHLFRGRLCLYCPSYHQVLRIIFHLDFGLTLLNISDCKKYILWGSEEWNAIHHSIEMIFVGNETIRGCLCWYFESDDFSQTMHFVVCIFSDFASSSNNISSFISISAILKTQFLKDVGFRNTGVLNLSNTHVLKKVSVDVELT